MPIQWAQEAEEIEAAPLPGPDHCDSGSCCWKVSLEPISPVHPTLRKLSNVFNPLLFKLTRVNSIVCH